MLIVINGESFRYGKQQTRGRGGEESLKRQYLATLSHIRFIKYIKEKFNVSSEIFLNSYELNTDYDNILLEWYKKYLIKYNFNKNIFKSEDEFVKNTLEQIKMIDINDYDYILLVRPDCYLKKYYLNIFKFDPCVTFSFIDSNGYSLSVNHSLTLIYKKYFDLFLEDKFWKIHHSEYFLLKYISKDKSKKLIESSHWCCTSLGWNPLFSYVGRTECLKYPTNVEKQEPDYMNFYEKYENYIGTDSIEENLKKIDISLNIEQNLEKLK